MGGSAFAKSFYTPRMSPEVYTHVRDRVVQVLREIYTHADAPVEAPEKEDYGDVDVLVCGPYPSLGPDAHNDEGDASTNSPYLRLIDAQLLIRNLCALHHIQPSPTIIHLALPWPKDFLDNAPHHPNAKAPEDFTDHSIPLAIQVDIHVVPTLALYPWTLLFKSHGDFWPLVGSVVRPFGLALNPTGLYLSILEFQSNDIAMKAFWNIGKEEGRVRLTTSPEDAIHYLGLRFELSEEVDIRKGVSGGDKAGPDIAKRPFSSVTGLFKAVCSCRFFRGGDMIRMSVEGDPAYPKGQQDKIKTKKQRPLARLFHDSFLPAHNLPTGEAADLSREEVVEEALDMFPEVREEYEEKVREKRREVQQRRFWDQLKSTLQTDITAATEVLENEKAGESRSENTTLRDSNEISTSGTNQSQEAPSAGRSSDGGDPAKAKQDQIEHEVKLVIRAVKRLVLPPPTDPYKTATTITDELSPTFKAFYEERDFFRLTRLIRENRVGLEREQREYEKERYLEHLKRTGKFKVVPAMAEKFAS